MPFLAVLAYALSSCSPRAPRGDDTPGEISGDPKADFYTTTYLSEAEALGVVFPDAARVVKTSFRLSDEEYTKVHGLVRQRVARRDFDVYLGLEPDGSLNGYAVIHREIGKFKYITFIVSVEPDGSARRVAVLVYRESRGGEVARRRFLVQYDGKTIRAPLSMNRDIINISGATMSVRAMNRGVKKVLAVVETIFRENPERLKSAIASGLEVQRHVAARQHSRDSRLVMGSLCEIEAYGDDGARVSRAVTAAFDEVERIDMLLSDYRTDSELSLISREGASREVPVSETTAEFLKHAAEISKASEGSFDLTVAPLVDSWGFRGGTARRPSPQEIDELRRLVDYRGVELLGDAETGYRVRLAREGVCLDPGGLGKGFAVDRAIALLEAHGVRSALVNFSGCFFALGRPPNREAWTVAVRDPSDPNRILGTMGLRDEALSTSGGYERFVEIDGERLGHVLSPSTLEPVPGVIGAIVRAPNATLADGWSTASTVLGKDAIALLEKSEELDGLIGLRSGLHATTRFRVAQNPTN